MHHWFKNLWDEKRSRHAWRGVEATSGVLELREIQEY
jgi:hypothetical protein